MCWDGDFHQPNDCWVPLMSWAKGLVSCSWELPCRTDTVNSIFFIPGKTGIPGGLGIRQQQADSRSVLSIGHHSTLLFSPTVYTYHGSFQLYGETPFRKQFLVLRLYLVMVTFKGLEETTPWWFEVFNFGHCSLEKTVQMKFWSSTRPF